MVPLLTGEVAREVAALLFSFGSLSSQTSPLYYAWSINHQGRKGPLFSLCWQCCYSLWSINIYLFNWKYLIPDIFKVVVRPSNKEMITVR